VAKEGKKETYAFRQSETLRSSFQSLFFVNFVFFVRRSSEKRSNDYFLELLCGEADYRCHAKTLAEVRRAMGGKISLVVFLQSNPLLQMTAKQV
jgi:hypothetical protein